MVRHKGSKKFALGVLSFAVLALGMLIATSARAQVSGGTFSGNSIGNDSHDGHARACPNPLAGSTNTHPKVYKGECPCGIQHPATCTYHSIGA